MGAGLRRVAKLYGGITINGKKYVWDYANDRPILEKSMTPQRWELSELARSSQMRTPLQCVARGCDGCSVCQPDKYPPSRVA